MLDSKRLELIQTSLAETVSPLRGTHDELNKLNTNIEAFTKSQDSLSEKVYGLTVIIALAGAAGTIIAGISLAKHW